MRMMTIAFVAAIATTTAVRAETVEIWHGWTNITPCSKIVQNCDGLFCVPVLKMGPQELHGSVKLDVPTTARDVLERAKQIATQCAAKGAAAAGVAALVTGGPGAWETFVNTFRTCMSETNVSDLVNIRLETRSECRY